jgi:TolA-binding protein
VRRLAGCVALLLCLLGQARTGSAAGSAKLPPPDLVGLVPLAVLLLDKPPVSAPAVALPPPPQALPPLPPPRYGIDPAQRPVAPIPAPRMLACNPIGSVLGVASELLECGRARYQKDDLEEALTALQNAVRESSDRRLIREARYWQGETLLRLGRDSEAERVFAPVVQDDPRSEFGLYAANELGWLALAKNDPTRALASFEGLLKLPAPPPLHAYARHGRAMSLYGLGRYADARDEWSTLLNVGGFSVPNLPRPLGTEASFWLADTLGRLGDYKRAADRLQTVAATPPPRLTESVLLRLGWWSEAAGRPLEAVKAYRTLLSARPGSSDVVWARAGLVRALLDLDDYAAARKEATELESADKNGTLSLPILLLMRAWLAEKSKPEEAHALDDALLARTLAPATRAWVLLSSGELARQSSQPEEARTRFDLVLQSPATPLLGSHAALRLAQLDFDIREFERAEAGAKALLSQALVPDVRTAALLLGAEAAYWARHYDEAAALYSRFLSESPQAPQAPLVTLALGWAEFRRGRLDDARQRWTSFASTSPTNPRAAEALLLSADLAATAGDLPTAQRLLGEIAARFPRSEQADVANLNRSILALNAGRAAEAVPELSLLLQRAPYSPYIGRARLARGVAFLAMGRTADAPADFRAALGQGEDALAHLGLGVVALARSAWEEAASEFAAAKGAASGTIAAAAEYGLAAAAFNQGKKDEFVKLATPLLSRPDDPRITPHLLRGMGSMAAEDKRWPEARDLALRLTSRFPGHRAGAQALVDVGTAAAADAQWKLVREMYERLAKGYPAQVAGMGDRLAFAEALLRTGAPADARRELESFVKSSRADPRMPRALVLLAEAQEATGNRAAALDIYTRLGREYPREKEAGTVLLSAARLLQADGRWGEARPILERALDQGDARLVGEAAFQLGEGLRAAGQNEEAAEAYMTAAYAAPETSWGRRALLGAGQSFSALKQNDAAVIVYKKLAAIPGVEPELLNEARDRLKALGAS